MLKETARLSGARSGAPRLLSTGMQLVCFSCWACSNRECMGKKIHVITCVSRTIRRSVHRPKPQRPRPVPVSSAVPPAPLPARHPAEAPFQCAMRCRDGPPTPCAMRRSPAFTMMTVLTLGAGLGARTHDLPGNQLKQACCCGRSGTGGPNRLVIDLERLWPGRANPPRHLGHRATSKKAADARLTLFEGSAAGAGGSEVAPRCGWPPATAPPRHREAHAHLGQPSPTPRRDTE